MCKLVKFSYNCNLCGTCSVALDKDDCQSDSCPFASKTVKDLSTQGAEVIAGKHAAFSTCGMHESLTEA